MTNYTVALGAAATALFPEQHETPTDHNLLYFIDKVIDFTTLVGPASTSDTLDVINIPPKTLVERGLIEVYTASATNTTGTLALALVAPATTLVTGVANSTVGITTSTQTTTSAGVVPAGTGTAVTIYTNADQPTGENNNTPGGTTARVSFATAFGAPVARFGITCLDISQVTKKIN